MRLKVSIWGWCHKETACEQIGAKSSANVSPGCPTGSVPERYGKEDDDVFHSQAC